MRKPLALSMVFGVAGVCAAIFACEVLNPADQAKRDGPENPKLPNPIKVGNKERGRDVFRFETFGTEGFWTDAVRLPQGMAHHRVTMLAALRNGVNFDSDALPDDVRTKIEREAKTDFSKAHAPMLNDPNLMPRLVRSNAVIGLVERHGKTGVTCALCHTITDGSVLTLGSKGSIGRRIDGRTPHGMMIGKLLALADNSRALYPTLQLDMGGKVIGRVQKYHLSRHSSEAQVDAYLSDPEAYPPGTFDDSPDGNGNSIHVTPLFRMDLAAPFGSSGQNDVLDDFSNAVYTLLFDQTDLLSPGGRKFIHALGGKAGDKMLADYAYVLNATHVKGYPFVVANGGFKPGTPATPAGKRVNSELLFDLNAYVVSLQAPPGHAESALAVARGRDLFRSRCTSCHNVDPMKPVNASLIPLTKVFPNYKPVVIAMRKPPLDPNQNSPGTFDDKMVVVDASAGGGKRGNALPMLLDLARKPVFLKDDSVKGLDALLNPKRGAKAPHPFYIHNASQRGDVMAFLRSLGTPR